MKKFTIENTTYKVFDCTAIPEQCSGDEFYREHALLVVQGDASGEVFKEFFFGVPEEEELINEVDFLRAINNSDHSEPWLWDDDDDDDCKQRIEIEETESLRYEIDYEW